MRKARSAREGCMRAASAVNGRRVGRVGVAVGRTRSVEAAGLVVSRSRTTMWRSDERLVVANVREVGETPSESKEKASLSLTGGGRAAMLGK